MNGLIFVPLLLLLFAATLAARRRLHREDEPEHPAVPVLTTRDLIVFAYDELGAAMDRIWPFQGGNDAHEQVQRG